MQPQNTSTAHEHTISSEQKTKLSLKIEIEELNVSMRDPHLWSCSTYIHLYAQIHGSLIYLQRNSHVTSNWTFLWSFKIIISCLTAHLCNTRGVLKVMKWNGKWNTGTYPIRIFFISITIFSGVLAGCWYLQVREVQCTRWLAEDKVEAFCLMCFLVCLAHTC